MRFFNTAGPVRPEEHYHIPPLDRLELDGVLTLIRKKILRPPRAAANGQDIGSAGAMRPAQLRRGLSLRVRQCETHLDQLADKLKEERMRRVVEPLLSGGEVRHFADRDVEYVRDLGLVG